MIIPFFFNAIVCLQTITLQKSILIVYFIYLHKLKNMWLSVKGFFVGAFFLALHKLGIKKNELYIKRIKECRSCPINKAGICSNDFFVSKYSFDVYRVVHIDRVYNKTAKSVRDMKRGCGCVCVFKAQIKEEKCPANFW